MKEDFVSVIIPCRNEEKYIANCLDSVLLQDFPKEDLEILVVDGASIDGTGKILQEYSKRYPFVKVLYNEKKFTSISMNLALKKSKGEIIIRLDSHAKYSSDYISKCVRHLKESGADNVGGVLKSLPVKNTLVAKAIALSLSSPVWHVGAHFRQDVKSVREVDTVFCGCYKKTTLQKIGYYNEHLVRSQDIELNLRLQKMGGKIMLFPDIVSYYYPKGTFKEFIFHEFRDGIWAVYPLKFTKTFFRIRHYLPLLLVMIMVLLSVASLFSKPFFYVLFLFTFFYVLAVSFKSLEIALKENKIVLIPFLLAAFAIRHFVYGAGSLMGLIRLVV